MRLGIRIVGAAVLGLLYVVGCHWLMTKAPASPWNAVGVLLPMVAAVAAGSWQGGQRRLGACAALLGLALCAQAALGLQTPPQRLYLAQHVGVNLCLALGFGATLRSGQSPLITTLARRVHLHFPQAMAVYTRQVTWAWTLFFMAMVVVSLAMYACGPFERWAIFANLLTPLAVALMFAAEYLLRYRLHPEFERTTVADAVRAYLGNAREARGGPAS